MYVKLGSFRGKVVFLNLKVCFVVTNDTVKLRVNQLSFAAIGFLDKIRINILFFFIFDVAVIISEK